MTHLHAVEPEDLDLMYIIENDMQLWQHASTTVPFSRYTLQRYIKESTTDLFRDQQVRFAIHDDNDTTCGFLDIINFSPMHSRAETGIVLMKDAQGRGLATIALREAWEYARQMHIRMLYSIVAEDNIQARKLFLRAGYRESAIIPSWLQNGDNTQNAILFQIS
ncbi:MAG: GNAT family N-acetyltransferase [Bacteroidaceae bacterium]|nr:GNAT family N-acetyltransferase [Bacteroidaceae bacterium]